MVVLEEYCAAEQSGRSAVLGVALREPEPYHARMHPRAAAADHRAATPAGCKQAVLPADVCRCSGLPK